MYSSEDLGFVVELPAIGVSTCGSSKNMPDTLVAATRHESHMRVDRCSVRPRELVSVDVF